MLLKKNQISVDYFYFLKIYSYANFMGQISNVLVSDIANAVALMGKSEKKIHITGVFILARMADILSITLLFMVTFLMNFNLLSSYFSFNFNKAVLLIIIAAAALVLAFFIKGRYISYFREVIDSGKNSLPEICIVTFLTYVCFSISAICDSHALNVDITTSILLLCYTVGSMITLLPISIAGIGTRDVAFIFIMGLANISSEKTIAMSMIGFIILPLLSVITLNIIALIMRGR